MNGKYCNAQSYGMNILKTRFLCLRKATRHKNIGSANCGRVMKKATKEEKILHLVAFVIVYDKVKQEHFEGKCPCF